MSEVRLSTGSPSLERMDVRVAEQPKPSACKNLFGTLDHEELKRDFKGRLREMEEEAAAKWSFDFVNHRPIPDGPFEWQAVDGALLPDFYKLQRAPGNKRGDVNGNREQQRGRAAGGRAELSEVPAGPQQEELPGDHAEQVPSQRKRPADPESLSRRKTAPPPARERPAGLETQPVPCFIKHFSGREEVK
ncbi:hypothetical protein Z043-114585 [Arapaima gigas]